MQRFCRRRTGVWCRERVAGRSPVRPAPRPRIAAISRSAVSAAPTPALLALHQPVGSEKRPWGSSSARAELESSDRRDFPRRRGATRLVPCPVQRCRTHVPGLVVTPIRQLQNFALADLDRIFSTRDRSPRLTLSVNFAREHRMGLLVVGENTVQSAHHIRCRRAMRCDGRLVDINRGGFGGINPRPRRRSLIPDRRSRRPPSGRAVDNRGLSILFGGTCRHFPTWDGIEHRRQPGPDGKLRRLSPRYETGQVLTHSSNMSR